MAAMRSQSLIKFSLFSCCQSFINSRTNYSINRAIIEVKLGVICREMESRGSAHPDFPVRTRFLSPLLCQEIAPHVTPIRPRKALWHKRFFPH